MNALLREQIGVSEMPHQRLNRLSDDLREESVSMAQELDALAPKVTLIIGTEHLEIQPEYHHLTVDELVKARLAFQDEDRLTEYLKVKYSCHKGLPKEFLKDEVLVEDIKPIHNWIFAELNTKILPDFVPFELVATIIKNYDEI